MLYKIKDLLRATIFPYISILIIRLIGITLRFETSGEENRQEAEDIGKGTIFSFWHGHLLFNGYYLYRLKNRRKGFMMISPSRDGEFLAKVIGSFNFGRVQGSAKRGGVSAILELSDIIKDGNDAILTPDGPRGPCHEVQSGVIHLAKKSGAVILPMALGAKKAKIFNSWDRFILPLPFSDVVIVFGKPLSVPPDAGPQELKSMKDTLEKETNRITEYASSYFATQSL